MLLCYQYIDLHKLAICSHLASGRMLYLLLDPPQEGVKFSALVTIVVPYTEVIITKESNSLSPFLEMQQIGVSSV